MNCLFCKIVNKEIAAQIIYENDHAVAFLDVHPRSPGHTLVIPKEHAATIRDLSDPEVALLFIAVKHVNQMLANRLAPNGITIGINQGRASGQEVDHVHVHLMPRWENDGGGSIQSVINNPPKESVEEIRNKILGK